MPHMCVFRLSVVATAYHRAKLGYATTRARYGENKLLVGTKRRETKEEKPRKKKSSFFLNLISNALKWRRIEIDNLMRVIYYINAGEIFAQFEWFDRRVTDLHLCNVIIEDDTSTAINLQ